MCIRDRLTDRLGYLCAGKAEVLSFERLAYRMISPGDQKVIDAAGKGMLLQRVCSRLAPELTYFSHCANQSGFLDDFMRLQKEWKQYSFESEKAKKMKMPDRPLLEKKMHDALLLFEAFEQAEENYFDSANTPVSYTHLQDDAFLLSLSSFDLQRPLHPFLLSKTRCF